ncbi:MAG: hypothetical protein AUG51_16145 [Acidobacteria bacterium 13_1_20CM_3_53_8]|nr:MAG: hypothetical protein AUG51_16145 [Acidobacteria bacterium 13_1_20CM_3_53_8]
MSRLSKMKDRLGRLGGKDSEKASVKLNQTATIDADTTVISDTTGTFSELTPEQAIARNYAILSKVSHDPPSHKKFMGWMKDTWRVVGPIAFIVCTVGEVYYYIKHFLPEDNSWGTQALLWGISLLIEIPFCMATFDLSERKERANEAKQNGMEPPDKDTPGAIGMWCMMALINIAGQMAFLFFITKAGDFKRDWPVYFFIALRVVGVILGDAYVAFFLRPSPTKLAHVLRHQKSQSEGFVQLTNQQMDDQLKKSRVQLQLEHNQRTIEREKSDADFMVQFHNMSKQHALRQQQRMIEREDRKELEGPKGDI